jgi:hypothetical protein
MEERLPLTDDDSRYLKEAAARGGTTIYAPGGEVVAGPMPGGEGILYADADLERIVPGKIVHDYAGDYNRFDIFQLLVNGAAKQPSIRIQAGNEQKFQALEPGDPPAIPAPFLELRGSDDSPAK